MIVPVIWLARDHHESGNMRRGWWDQTLLADVLDGKVWRLPHGLEFVDYEANEIHRTDWCVCAESVDRCYEGQISHGHPCCEVCDHDSERGAVVVIPGRFHADPEGVMWVNEQIAKLPWCVVVVTSDEESLMPVWQIKHPHMRLWVMTPRPGKPYPPATRFIGEGYSPGTREALAQYQVEQESRPIDVAFAGQVTHQRRVDLMAALDRVNVDWIVDSLSTPGFTQGHRHEVYIDVLQGARIAPCPAGPGTPDSFRAYEAMEAGCMPVLDSKTPEGWTGFWRMVYGADFIESGIPVITEWEYLPEMMPDLIDNYPANANRAGSWWQSYKREMVRAMADDVTMLAFTAEPGEITMATTLADLITVVMPTSPIPSHPSTEIIDSTIASIRARLPDCDILITCDGVRPEQDDRRADYDEYVRKLVWKCNHVWSNVLPIVFDEHRHQSGAMIAALEKIDTPLVLYIEHDTPLVGDIEFSECARFIASGQANVVRFHHESEILPSAEHMMLDRHALSMGAETDEHATRTAAWSQRPHLASTRFYRWIMSEFFTPEARTMIEDTMYGVVSFHWNEQGVVGWEKFKIWIYTPPTPQSDGGIQRSEHLDGRGSDPKFDMLWIYADDDDPPPGAPAASSRRDD